MIYNSPYFSREEFACKCGCGQDTIDADLFKVLVAVREFFGSPVSINSGNRCYSYNEKVQVAANPNYVKGSSNSQHVKSRAADIVVKGRSPDEVADFLEKQYKGKLGIGRYKTFTHVDSRNTEARWDNS